MSVYLIDWFQVNWETWYFPWVKKVVFEALSITPGKDKVLLSTIFFSDLIKFLERFWVEFKFATLRIVWTLYFGPRGEIYIEKHEY